MGASRAILLVLAVSLPLAAQTAGRKHAPAKTAQAASAGLLRDAEAAIDKQDYAAAEPKLLQATTAIQRTTAPGSTLDSSIARPAASRWPSTLTASRWSSSPTPSSPT